MQKFLLLLDEAVVGKGVVIKSRGLSSFETCLCGLVFEVVPRL